MEKAERGKKEIFFCVSEMLAHRTRNAQNTRTHKNGPQQAGLVTVKQMRMQEYRSQKTWTV